MFLPVIKPFNWNKIFNSYVFVAVLLLAGLFSYLLKPAGIMKEGCKYQMTAQTIMGADSFCLANHPVYDLVLAVNSTENVIIKCLNSETGNLTEMEYFNLRVHSAGMRWVEDNAWLCVDNINSGISLVQVFDEQQNSVISMQNIHHPFYKDSLYTARTKIGGRVLTGFRVDTELENGFKLTSSGDSLYMVLSEEINSAICNVTILDYTQSAEYQEMADSLSVWLSKPVNVKDIFCLIANTRRTGWFRNLRDSGITNTRMGGGQIVAAYDINNDGIEELLIITGGSRFTPSSIICYDLVSKGLLWEYVFYEGFRNIDIADLDQDGLPEILIGTSASAVRHGSNWFELEEPLYSFFSSLLILDNMGKIKKFNQQKAHIITGDFGWFTDQCVLPDNTVLFASDSPFSGNSKNLKLLHSETLQVDTLDISFTNLHRLDRIKGNTVLTHTDKEKNYKTVISDDLQIIETKEAVNEYRLQPVHNRHYFEYENEVFWLYNPLTIYDDDFHLIYQNTKFRSPCGLQIRGNKVYFTAIAPDGDSTLMCLSINRNGVFNPVYLVLWLLFIVVGLVYIITKAFFNLPAKVLDGSYAVLYQVLGVFYNWRIFGSSSIYSQPVLASLSRKRFYNTISDLADSYQKVKTRNLGVVKLYFFRLVVDNDMHIIQRIAHDIKNQVHLVNMKLMETSALEGSELEYSMRTIYKKAAMLSDFSRINLMQKTTLDLVGLLDIVLLKFNGHPRYQNIIWELSEQDIMVDADENLLQVAIINVIENSLRYSPADSLVNITLSTNKLSVRLTIKNEILLEKDKISNGSGIGMLATNKIITAHGGEFIFKSEGKAVALIELPCLDMGVSDE